MFTILKYIFICDLFLLGNKLHDFVITVIAKDVCIDCSTWYLEKIVVLVYIGRRYIIMYFCCCFYCVMHN
jgi:hypothetical protein